MRSAANWLARNAGLAGAIYTGNMNNVEWLKDRQDLIAAYRDEPKILEELQRAVKSQNRVMINTISSSKLRLNVSALREARLTIPKTLSAFAVEHYEITGWYGTRTDEYGGLSPREYLSDKGWKNDDGRFGCAGQVQGVKAMKQIALSDMTTADLVERFAQIGVAQGKALLRGNTPNSIDSLAKWLTFPKNSSSETATSGVH